MYMTSSLGSAWNSLRCARPRATKAMVSGACQRMLTGLTLLRMPSETSARLTALSSVILRSEFAAVRPPARDEGDGVGRLPENAHRLDALADALGNLREADGLEFCHFEI